MQDETINAAASTGTATASRTDRAVYIGVGVLTLLCIQATVAMYACPLVESVLEFNGADIFGSILAGVEASWVTGGLFLVADLLLLGWWARNRRSSSMKFDAPRISSEPASGLFEMPSFA